MKMDEWLKTEEAFRLKASEQKKSPGKQSVGVMQVRWWQGLVPLISVRDMENGLYKLKLNATKTKQGKGRAAAQRDFARWKT